MAEPQSGELTNEEYVLQRLAYTFNLRQKPSYDKFKKSIEGNEESQKSLQGFVKDASTHLICVLTGAETASISIDVPNPGMFKRKGIIALRISQEPLTPQSISREVIFIEMTRQVLEHLYQHFQEIYMPILHNPNNQAGWSDLVSKDLMEKFNNYLAQVYVTIGLIHGKTLLPLPPYKLTVSESTPDKDKAHIFEGSIITWTRQIKNVLKLEPEQALKGGNDPDPLVEITFWKKKSENLNSIYQQLQSDRVKKILKFLEQNKSTYTIPFAKLQKEVQGARLEANDNYRFLQTLEPYFNKLVAGNKDFATLYEEFLPIMHTILLIWKHSKYYNTPPRLVVLIREICNAIIAKARDFISGPAIFALIGEGDSKEACNKLQIAIDISTKFKDTYFEYKAKANGGWKLTTNALFVRLDSFLERCHDILNLCQTHLQFTALEKIEIGGTKGKSLSESVRQIFQEFKDAVDLFQAVKYDIMNIAAKEFNDDFYQFRSKIKELERRLASVITQGFDDCDTIYGRFKLLDSFEALLSRPIIQDELEKKHIILIESYKQDLKSVQQIFLEGKALADKKDERAPLYNNLPPIAGALTWCRSLLDRIKEPMDKLQSLSQAIIDREEFKDVQKLYQSIVKSIKEYEDSKILAWEKESDETSQEKLKEFLLKRDEEELLKVNFDPALVRLLRETRYFHLLDQSVPRSAEDVYKSDDIYRNWVLSLDGIVFKYNNIKKCLHPVEEPLVIERIRKMDEILKPAFNVLIWKSEGIDKFISTAKDLIESIDSVVQKMKGDLEKIRQSLAKFDVPLLERKNKPMAPDEFMNIHQALLQNKQGVIKGEGGMIHKLVKEISEALKTDKKSAIWKNYLDYVNEIILLGVIKAIQTSCNYLNEQINHANIEKHSLQPIFDIKIELDRVENKIRYEPDIGESDKGYTVVNSVNIWVRDFLYIGTMINRLDGPGDFLTEIRDSFEIKDSLSSVYESLGWVVDETAKFKAKFASYAYLWESDPKSIFNQFLEDEVNKELTALGSQQQQQQQQAQVQETATKDKKGGAAGGPTKPSQDDKEEFVFFEESLILLKGVVPNVPKLSLFDEKITNLKAIQQEISSIKSHIEIGWLKINVQPLKNALDIKVTSSVKVYTEFLLSQVKLTLKNLKEFVGSTNKGIQKNPIDHEENTELLMSVMKTIAEVRTVEGKTEKLVKRLKEMVALLKKHSVTLEEDYFNSIDNTYNTYYETSRKVFEVKAAILPLQTREAQALKKRLDQFTISVQNFRNDFLQNLPFSYDDKMDIMSINKCYDKITEYYMELCKVEEEAKEYNNLENLFEMEQTNYKQLKDCRQDLKFLKVMWDCIAMVTYQYDDWKSKTWKSIKADILTESNKILSTQVKALPKEIRNFKGYPIIVDKVKNMQTLLPLISSLHSEFMEDRHWKEIMTITGKEFDHQSPTFNFNDILQLELYKYEAAVNEIVDKAQKEAKIEKKLKTIESNWIKQVFEFFDEKQYETKLFQPLDNMVELLDANSMDLMGMMSQGKYVEFFKVTVEQWRETLKNVDAVIGVWLKVQKNWRRLVNIFVNSEDIRAQLPDDTKRFESLDKDFREMMIDVSNSPGVVDCCTPERKELLDGMLTTLEQCEKALNEYLEDKKKAFPRFYFVSNQALLDILSNGTNPHKVVEYLGDCFDGMKDLKFEVDPTTNQKTKSAVGMYSKEYEYVPFSSNFVCEGPVEVWLSSLEFKMRATLAEILEEARGSAEFWEVEKPRQDWVKLYCAQLALVTTQIVWTEEVNRAFEDLNGGAESAMKEYLKLIENRIEKLIEKVRDDKITSEDRTKIITIITIDVHSRDVVQKFVNMKLSDNDAFAWQSQLKFYWEKLKDNEMASKQVLRFPWEKDREKAKCYIKIVDWQRFYSYEYVGNCGRLVITPLTDRCYITLTQALNLNMGGAPAGPAGTGKTETTKDLGRAIGLPVMVFNCSDQMNYESMAQIFMGLSQSGAWGCFDEFNRISIEVLSVVSTQVKTVLDALKDKKIKFEFMDKQDIALVDTVGFFITMNPGYAGRTELPENLKALFRSCAMVVPDIVLICENMLMSEGFSYARELSKKFVTLYDLSKALLSKQIHYDWGLRAVKSVLRQAGKLRRADPLVDEDPLLKRALKEFNVPKIVLDDVPIFTNLLEDLFPDVKAPEKFDAVLKKLVETATKEQGYLAENLFALKCVQLSEILEVRHCCFVIGPAGCGKTTIWKTLAQAYINRGQDTLYDTINPKAVTADELFGYMTKSKEWKDGVLSNIMRNQSKNLDKYKPSHLWKWVILDGDIDPEWIESLNTVMDDNKLLTLVSNERIPLSAPMRLLFEVSNLRNATPATVSRGGVLYVNESDVGWKPYMESWIERSVEAKKPQRWRDLNPSPEIDDIAKSVYYRCFEQYFEGTGDYHKLKRVAPSNDIIMVQTSCAIIDALMTEYGTFCKTLKEDDQKIAYECFFLFAGMWAVGGAVGGSSDDDRDVRDFNAMWRANAKIKYPEGGMCFDYFYDPTKLNWIHWNTKVETYAPAEEVQFAKIYVPTVHTTRIKYLMGQHIMRKKPMLFVGSAGTGKTAVIRDYLAGVNPEKSIHATFNFNSFTDSLAVQRNIESRVEKKSGKTYGLPSNKILIYFIDDLNMPYVDKYGTQTPIALIRQLIDYGSVYDRDHLEDKKFIEDVLFVSALNPKSGSFTIDLRLQRHFSLFAMPTPTPDLLKTIYGQILNAHMVQFEAAFTKLTDKFIDGTTLVFNKILKDPLFSPSAKKFHYQFNLREISKVIEGVMMSVPASYKGNPSKMIKLWVHEMRRVFEDRLINEEDMRKFNEYLQMGYKFVAEDDKEAALTSEPNLFTSFITTHYGNDKAYVPVESMAALKKVLDDKLNEYNDLKAQMNLVLFNQAMEHICRICRILDQPAGHALLIGVGGSGKQSLSKLSAFIVGIDIDSIVVSQNYTINDLKTFLQELVKKCVKTPGNARAFMLTDSQIQEERYLVFINDMLSSGYIPDLFPKDEIEGLVNSMRNEAKSNGYPDNYDGFNAFFLDKLKRNLHLILCFSPVGEKFRIRARKFPGLINSTMIDWFHGWPHSALIDVAARFLSDVELPSEELREAIALNMAAVHTSIDDANKRFLRLERRYNYTTPKSFLELIDFYKNLLNKKRDYILNQISRLENGLQTLAETQSKVKGLQEDLKVKMIEVDDKKEKTEVLIEEVTRESDKAAAEQAIANEEEAKCNELADAAAKKAAEADKALQHALPALEEAKAAVKCIDKNAITEMKSLPTPPPLVQVVAKAVLILMSNDKLPNEPIDKTWKRSVQVMNDPSKFLGGLLSFAGENIPDHKLAAVKLILDDPSNLNFDFAEVKKKNTAAAYLGKWLTSMVKFNHVYKIVAPLDEAQRQAKEQVDTKMKELAVVKERVRVINEKVDGLKRKLDEAVTEKQAVEDEAAKCLQKLQTAEELVTGLSDENKRWGENVKNLKVSTNLIIGDVLLSAAFVSYIGAFSAGFRKDLWQNRWIPDIKGRKIPMSENIEPLQILTTDSAMAKWRNEGLPADKMSLENASIITSCSRWPLMIDPQLQGSTWIREANGGELVVLSLTQDKWMNKLINAITMGKVVLIENLSQEIDPTLDPLLSRAIIKKGRNKIIELGGDPVDYDDNFKLYLQTKLSNPHFRPELAAQCTIINFIVTEYGLEEQLLAKVVNVERPELESEKSELVRKQNEFQVKLAQLEENLLNALSEADPATILDNVALISSLKNTKATANEIAIQSEKSRITEAEINIQRELYRKVAAEGSTLYFLIISLCFIDHMYQYSLEAFETFFFKAIERVPVKDETRVDELRKNIRYTIYQWVSRGLFEKHKLIFLSLITFRLMQKKVIEVPFDATELQFLLQAAPKPGVDNPLDWLPAEAWGRVQRLIDLDEFKNFAQNMEKDAPSRFKDWYNELTPEDAKLPLDWKRLDNNMFKKILVLRCLRPDRITAAMTSFIRNTLPDGTSFVEMDQKLSFIEILNSAYEDSNTNTPLFFILSPGADPVKDVERLAKKKGFEPNKNFFSLALGQGQDVVAMERLERGHKEGHWVMLQNIHLMPRFLIGLEKKLDQFAQDAGGTNPAFRLYLSAEPSPDIPIGILDRCIKLTNEPPAGLKANMKRAWTYFQKEEVEDRDPRVKTILFGLCFFHSTVLERRKFGPMGWNMFYPFNIGDLRDSANVLNKYFEGSVGKIPWDDLTYIFGEIMYGGHIVDDWDRKLCRSYLEQFMNNNLFDEAELFPFIEGKNLSFKCPLPSPYEKYLEYIETTITGETPLAYGLHPNAEIGFRTSQCNVLFNTLLELQPKDSGSTSGNEESGGQVKTKQEIVNEVIVKCIQEDYDLRNKLFIIEDIRTKIDDVGPYQNVFLQECEYMNMLLQEIIRSLDECDQGMKGLLTISEKMEQLMDAIALDRVPATWSKLAYPSRRGLASWLDNLMKRIEQLNNWKDDPIAVPKVTFVSRLFNPQSFLTAIKQVMGRKNKWELNKVMIATDVTKKSVDEIDQNAKEGSYIFGLVLEGARWDGAIGQLDESRPKEMFNLMPVIYCRAVLQPAEGKEEKGYYYCPCYVTEDRGKTYVFTAQLKTKHNPRKWILGGVALLMDIESINDDVSKKKAEKNQTG